MGFTTMGDLLIFPAGPRMRPVVPSDTPPYPRLYAAFLDAAEKFRVERTEENRIEKVRLYKLWRLAAFGA